MKWKRNDEMKSHPVGWFFLAATQNRQWIPSGKFRKHIIYLKERLPEVLTPSKIFLAKVVVGYDVAQIRQLGRASIYRLHVPHDVVGQLRCSEYAFRGRSKAFISLWMNPRRSRMP